MIGQFFSKFMALIVLAVAALALFLPVVGTWINTSWINYLLMIIMFGMGLTMKPSDFLIIFKKPKEVIIGCLAQFLVMPVLAFLLVKIFNLSQELAVGVILVGCCPGGSASNVITYFSKGDVALSIGMTSITTLLAPLLTPLLTYLFLQTTVTVDFLGMFLNILMVIVLPIGLGLIINIFFYKHTKKITVILPTVSTISICLIIACVVSNNASKILNSGAIILIVVILHNLLGYLLGFIIGKIFKMTPEKTKAISVEIGMQNSGLATSLAATSFTNLSMATVPGAIFSVWHNLSGALLSAIYRRWNSKDNKEEINEESNDKIEENKEME